MNPMASWIRLAYSLLLGACLSLPWSGVPASQGPAGETKTVSKAFFGMHIHHADTSTSWPGIAIGSFRAWDAHTTWVDLEPAKGKWNFSRLDRLVSLATDHSVSIMLTLGGTPNWASARPDESSAYGRGFAAEASNLNDWANYVRTVATRYRGRIKMYELANEPYFRELDAAREQRFFSGSVKTMVTMASMARKVLKEIDPEIQLISPGFDNHADRLELFLKNGGGKLVDGVAVHLYTSDQNPEAILANIKEFKSVLAKYKLNDKPLFCTEIGYDPDWIPRKAMLLPFPDLLAAYIARVHVLGAAAGLGAIYWYSWDGLGGGLADAASGSLNKAGKAYAQTLRWLQGSSVRGCQTEDGSLWTCDLVKGNRTARMVWNTKGNRQWSLPANWAAMEYESLTGTVAGVAKNNVVQIGPAPVLIKSDTLPWANENS